MTGYQSKKAAAQAKLDSMEREALKLALEALEELNNTSSYWWHEVDEATVAKIDSAITAIKETLAQPAQEPWPEEPFGHMAGGVQPAQEPVAWMSSDKAWMWSDYSKALAAVAHNPRLTLIPLYTAPPQREPLTESQIIKIINAHTHDDSGHDDIWVDGEAIARAIEAAHGIKEKNNG